MELEKVAFAYLYCKEGIFQFLSQVVRNAAKCVYLLFFLVFHDTFRLGISMPTFFTSSSQMFIFLNGVMQNERTLNMRVLYHEIGL